MDVPLHRAAEQCHGNDHGCQLFFGAYYQT